MVRHGALPTARGGGGFMRRLNLLTAIGAGLAFGGIGWLISHHFMQTEIPKTSDQVVLITLTCWCLGFMAGIGAFNGPLRWFLGRDPTYSDEMFLAGKDQGVGRYFRFTTDHKVVGIQYLVMTMILLGVGGTMAMLIRTNLISPHSHFLGPQTYNSLVGLHGIIMIMATIIMVTGPFGNFILPIMIGARDMAFPRLNALSFWLLGAAVPCMLAAGFMGGIPTGWSAYSPLSDQSTPGMDGYLIAIIVFAISSAVAGANITTTVLTMRARGMTWNRTPIFVYGVVASVGLALPALPMFMTSQILLALDRSMEGQFYVASGGGSPWLYQNLFWLFGHPEVYVIVIPAVVALMEITPVFARKPLYNFNAAVLGIVGITGLSIMVWAHHMYASGWAPDLNGPFMLTTELISVPTGVLFLVVIGTIWRGRNWMTVPMLAVYAMLWNFIIGGITGIYLSDIPADYALHGSMFVTAHFHYTLMGAGLTGAIGALYYWFPKMTGRMLDHTLGLVAFWLVQIGFNVTFLGMFAVGLAGQPRRVFTYPHMFATGNFVSTIGAYFIGVGMLINLYNVISSWRSGRIAPANPWGGKTLEWAVPNPIPLANFAVLPVVIADAYGYGEGDPTPPHWRDDPHPSLPPDHERQPVPTGAATSTTTLLASRPESAPGSTDSESGGAQ
jgi:cytochrome c oxidase subunit 1